MSRTSVAAVKSGRSRTVCRLRFKNHTRRVVNLVWIDFLGYPKNFGALPPDRSLDIHSYEGHPWLCEDLMTKTPLLLNKKFLFYPTPPKKDKNGNVDKNLYSVQQMYDNSFRDNGHHNAPTVIRIREYVHITLPVLSLAQISAETINKRIPDVEDINRLHLPKRLKSMLQTLHYYP